MSTFTMLGKILVTLLPTISVIQARMNHFVRVDSSAPELEIDQRQYTNHNNIQLNNVTEAKESEEIQKIFPYHHHKTEKKAKKVKSYDNYLENMYSIAENLENIQQSQSRTENKLSVPPEEDVGISSYLPLYDENFEARYKKDDMKFIPRLPDKQHFGPPKRIIGPMPKNPRNVFRGTGPKGMDEGDKPDCDTFSKTARFNPYSILDGKWFAIYYWTYENAPNILEFIIPTKYEITFIRDYLDKQVKTPINWNTRLFVMNDLVYNGSTLLVERGEHGEYWMYPIIPNITAEVEPEDVRFKQTSDNKYIAIILCSEDRAYIMSRMNEVPLKEEIPDIVARLGWRGRDGRSYLNTGHNWGPIDYLDEDEFWAPANLHKREVLPPAPPEDDDYEDINLFEL